MAEKQNKRKLVMVGCSKFSSATAALTGPTSCAASVKGMFSEIRDLLCCFPLLVREPGVDLRVGSGRAHWQVAHLLAFMTGATTNQPTNQPINEKLSR